MKSKENKNKEISTKDLYLLEFVEVSESKFVPGKSLLSSGVSYKEKSTGVFVIGRKKSKDNHVFKEIFTGSIYKDEYEHVYDIKKGALRVKVISPIVSNRESISYEEATIMLQNHNFYLIDKDCKEKTKELLEFFQKFNSYSNIEPENAEYFAAEILNFINNKEQETTENHNSEAKSKVLVKK